MTPNTQAGPAEVGAGGGFTPGDWHVVDGGQHWNNPAITNYRLHAASGTHGFNVAWSPDGELVAEHVYELADAQLMAAAPELLAALQSIVASLSEQDDEGLVEHAELMVAARAAIAKAVQP